MKLLLIILSVISLNLSASEVCKIKNQWKCDLYITNDFNTSGLLDGREVDHAFFNTFKTGVEESMSGVLPNFMKDKFSLYFFRYYIKYEQTPDLSNFTSLWKFTKYIVRETSDVTEMDFSEFVIALKYYNIESVLVNE